MEECVKGILINSGWNESRSVNIQDIVDDLVQWGYKSDEIFEQAQKLFEEYGYLEFKFNQCNTDKLIKFKIDSRETGVSKFVIEQYEKHYDTKLIPFTEIARFNMTMFISEDWKIYAAADSFIRLMGETFLSFVYNIYKQENYGSIEDVELIDVY